MTIQEGILKKKNGTSTMERWLEVETDILFSLYPKYGADFCNKLLPNRTKKAIILKASKLKIKLLEKE